jgi:nucleoside-diphosphate-sugar epimerase
MRKTCVITGGAGFIGSNLCDRLLSEGYSVVCIDNLLTGKKENLEEAKKSQFFQFINHDVIFPLSYDIDASYVFHLASPASVVDYQKYPEETALVNSVGTRNMLQFAKKHNARFLISSTSEVYGDPKEHPQKETYWGNVNPIGIRACYDEAKRFGEMMTMLYARKHKLDARIVRIFNTYGPRMRKDDGRVISNFINQALEGTPITIYGDGNQTRSFCYVSDMVDGLLKVMFSNDLGGQVYNLGNPEEYTIVDLAQKIIDMVHTKSAIHYEPLPSDDPLVRRPDITKITKATGWKPSVSVDSGLEKTVSYYRSI